MTLRPALCTFPDKFPGLVAGPGFIGTTVNAANPQIAMCGPVRWSDGATHSIRQVSFALRTVVKAGGTDLVISLQNAHATNGPPIEPDETPDETVVVADADYASNSIITTGNLSADRAVANGEIVCVVIGPDGGTFAGADSFQLAGLGTTTPINCGVVLDVGGTVWTLQSGVVSMVTFVAADGTLGTLVGAFIPCSALSTVNLQSDTTPDEGGLYFEAPFTGVIDGIKFESFSLANAEADFELVYYEDTTEIISPDFLANQVLPTAGTSRFGDFAFPGQNVTRGEIIRITIRPNQATHNVSIATFTCTAAHLPAFDALGATALYTSRTDAGAFSQTAAVRCFASVKYCQIDDGAGAGSGPVGRIVGSGSLIF